MSEDMRVAIVEERASEQEDWANRRFGCHRTRAKRASVRMRGMAKFRQGERVIIDRALRGEEE